MAEFCLNCWNRRNHVYLPTRAVVTGTGLCEDCRRQAPVIVALRGKGLPGRLQRILRRIEHWVWRRRRKTRKTR